MSVDSESERQILNSGDNETLSGIEVLDPGLNWKVGYNMWSNDSSKRPLQPYTDWFGILHECIFGVEDGMDWECSVWFRPDPVTISRKQVYTSESLSIPFCYDYLCEDRASKIRCTDPEYSKVNNRHWVLHLDLKPHVPPPVLSHL